MTNQVGQKKISLVIPVYNEEPHLLAFLEKVDQLDLGHPKELVIVNDASKDNSKKIIEGFSFKSEYQFYSQPINRGKGAALQKGIQMASGDIIGIQDADFEYDTSDLPAIIEPLVTGKADIVYGSRFKKSNNQVFRTYHYLVNRMLTIISNLLSGLYLTDMETCYKFFVAEIIKGINLESSRFGFEPEVTAKIARLRVRVMEVPISYFPRNYLEGKKITWKDGVAALHHLIVFNLLRKPEKMFNKNMPERYLLHKRGWL